MGVSEEGLDWIVHVESCDRAVSYTTASCTHTIYHIHVLFNSSSLPHGRLSASHTQTHHAEICQGFYTQIPKRVRQSVTERAHHQILVIAQGIAQRLSYLAYFNWLLICLWHVLRETFGPVPIDVLPCHPV